MLFPLLFPSQNQATEHPRQVRTWFIGCLRYSWSGVQSQARIHDKPTPVSTPFPFFGEYLVRLLHFFGASCPKTDNKTIKCA